MEERPGMGMEVQNGETENQVQHVIDTILPPSFSRQKVPHVYQLQAFGISKNGITVEMD